MSEVMTQNITCEFINLVYTSIFGEKKVCGHIFLIKCNDECGFV